MAETPQIPSPPDPEALQKELAEIAEKSAKVVAEFMEHPPQADLARSIEELGLGEAFGALGTKLLSDPARLAEVQMRAWSDYLQLWNSTLAKFRGEPGDPVKQPAKGDNRFRNDAWQQNFVFDYIKQSYLIAADHIQRTVAETSGLEPQAARKVRFFTRQIVDALAPTNFVATNPEVLKATVESGGKNLLDGLKHLLGDLDRGHGKLAISMTDLSAFELGRNVATTPGQVVFQNDLMQLLQYDPATPRVDRTPLLICPPWINKYYILDLRAKNSFIKWATDQGLTVFVISWVNPDERHAGKTFDDYLLEGPVAAMDAVEQATGEKSVNLIGYCLGGTLTACLMAWLKARGEEKRVKSVTFFTTMIDFTEPGELGVFVDEGIVDKLEKRMEARGYLEGADMAGTFNMLRDNDLIWSFVVNNYLLGKEPFPFDLLFWNSDATRMPAKMHTFYLRNMYIRNLLAQPAGLEVAGEDIDLSTVTAPAYFISTAEDHIAPWKSTFAGASLLGGDVRFVLGGSGHIAGIVNPPAAQKYHYWTGDQPVGKADDWFARATRHEGSWWNDWATWIHGFGGGQVDARIPGKGGLPVIEPAPGSYAKVRLDAGDAGAKCAPVSVAKSHPAAVASAPAPVQSRAPTAGPAVSARTTTPPTQKPDPEPAATKPRKAKTDTTATKIAPQLAKPAATAKSAKSRTTAEAAKPTKPAKIRKLAAPAEPVKPAKPPKAKKPAAPAAKSKPAKPAKPPKTAKLAPATAASTGAGQAAASISALFKRAQTPTDDGKPKKSKKKKAGKG